MTEYVVNANGKLVNKDHDRPNKKAITKELALTANFFEHKTKTNSDGSPLRVRRNGKTQVWKTRPNDFRIPVKYGLYIYHNITQGNCDEWYVPE